MTFIKQVVKAFTDGFKVGYRKRLEQRTNSLHIDAVLASSKQVVHGLQLNYEHYGTHPANVQSAISFLRGIVADTYPLRQDMSAEQLLKYGALLSDIVKLRRKLEPSPSSECIKD